mmetsp:Transcript_29966/g.71969  ORF Transcript_29966/g.71969 Transcript_29966/m.71969 type:complete len:227 (-) Transcript_29966:538-1218(-)
MGQRCLQKISGRFLLTLRHPWVISIGNHETYLQARIPTRIVYSILGFAKSSDVTVAKSLPEAFRNASLYSDERTYRLVRFPTSSMSLALQLWNDSSMAASTTVSTSKPAPFGGFLVDKDEITMVVPSDVYLEYCNMNTGKSRNDLDHGRDNGIEYRLFTFDNVVLDPSLVGFMAVVTRALADHDISVLPYAAYSTDHIFVAEQDAEKTRSILEGLPDNDLTTNDTD